MYFNQKLLVLTCLLTIVSSLKVKNTTINKRALQKEHEKSQRLRWVDSFLGKSNKLNYQLESLVKLLHTVTNELNNCTVVILYDSSAEDIDRIILEKLLKKFPLGYVHGRIGSDTSIVKELLSSTSDRCISFMLFLTDVMRVKEIIGKQAQNKVVVVSRSSQWRVQEFLSSDIAKAIVNLLVISKSEQIYNKRDIPYILYTHKLYIDGLGSSQPHILMSWYRNKLTQPNSPIFPKKIADGFAAHRFFISVAHQPPFIINNGIDANDDVKWDGVEIRLIKLIAELLNFTTDFHEANDDGLGAGDAVTKVMRTSKADLGLAGLYATTDKSFLEMSAGHSEDCAAFISLTSTALPRYRAIMGPFQWTVWLALTITYMLAIFPLAFSDRLTLSHLIQRPEEMENMFWYVFGTFTNCFTFKGKNSWSKTEKTSTRLFIGWYWVFTIIISACYTGSIIAFVTLPVFPTTMDRIQQFISGHFQLGTLDKGGWQYWFENVTDEKATKILKNMEYLPDIPSGLRNITRAFFWPYSFLGSRDQLDYIIRTNFTTSNKRSVMHISTECFAHFTVSMAYPKNSVYSTIFNSLILRAFQSGLVTKIKNDVEWDMMRSSTGKLLQANSIGKVRLPITDDRALTTQDTQGMFLLLGAGFLIGAACLISEIVGGCIKFCKTGKITRINSATISRSFHVPTPNEQKSETIEFILDEDKQPIQSQDTLNECFENTVTVHNTLDRHDSEDTSVDGPDSLTKSEIDNEINRLFCFDHLFGENNSVHSIESVGHLSDNFGESVHDYNSNSNLTRNCNEHRI